MATHPESLPARKIDFDLLEKNAEAVNGHAEKS
jgi:hypothetical protein